MTAAPSKLTGAAAIPLGYALVSHVARTSGIRALVIKGLILEQLGLRDARAYADIDVLVEPDRFDDFVAQLGEYGWHERIHLWLFDRIDEHSTTLIHDSWPVDIDVHRYYPGFLLPPKQVFDALWEHRRDFEIAERTVVGTDEVAGAAVLGLHALRWLHTRRNINEYQSLVARLRSDVELARRLALLAAETGSTQTLGPLFDAINMSPVGGPPVSQRELRAWHRRVSHPSRTGEWLTYLGRIPIHRRPREVLIVLWPPRELYLQEHPEIADEFSALFRARAKRIAHGIAGLSKALPAGHRLR